MILLSACGSTPPLPEVRIIEIGCPSVTRCQLPASNPQTNGDLRRNVEAAEAAWHDCASQVDAVYECQQKQSNRTSTGSKNE
ncbi:Rz1-like lysis system protein LysC [Methylotenera oryzisoli]|uniref:Rz1-like lysis system protein LysC n=1 Tax=Methylotenera oryzisoli TaxID=2080758 RepID=UPI003CC91AA7